MVVCQDRAGVEEDRCDQEDRPGIVERCNQEPCPAWNYGEWGKVKKSEEQNVCK